MRGFAMRDYSGLSGWLRYNIITVIFVKQRQEISGTKGDVSMKNLEQSKIVE